MRTEISVVIITVDKDKHIFSRQAKRDAYLAEHFEYSQKLRAHQALLGGQWNPEDPDGQQEKEINTISSFVFMYLSLYLSYMRCKKKWLGMIS